MSEEEPNAPMRDDAPPTPLEGEPTRAAKPVSGVRSISMGAPLEAMATKISAPPPDLNAIGGVTHSVNRAATDVSVEAPTSISIRIDDSDCEATRATEVPPAQDVRPTGALPATMIRPIGDRKALDEEPTRITIELDALPDPPTPVVRAPSSNEPPTIQRSSRHPRKRTWLLATGAGAGLVMGIASVWAFAGDDAPTLLHDERTPTASVSEGEEVAVRAPSIELATDAPPLAEAANLAVSGRFVEAARAYAALARDNPERPELATMARILAERAER